MRKLFALLLAVSLLLTGVLAGAATAEEEKIFVGYLSDAAMHSLYLHLGDGTNKNIGMNLGDSAVTIIPEEAGLALGERLLVKAVQRDGAYEATEITVLTCLAGVVLEHDKNGFSIDDGGGHAFAAGDAIVDFPGNGFLPGDLVEVVYDGTKEDEPVYQVFIAETLEGVVDTCADDYLLLTCEDRGNVTFDLTGANKVDLADQPEGQAVVVTFFGDLDTSLDILPANVYSVVPGVH